MNNKVARSIFTVCVVSVLFAGLLFTLTPSTILCEALWDVAPAGADNMYEKFKLVFSAFGWLIIICSFACWKLLSDPRQKGIARSICIGAILVYIFLGMKGVFITSFKEIGEAFGGSGYVE